ncbi:MAG: hypothetical protein H6684_15960 [Deltaproteobacteria bacterium]|nr:hypothetical protein [bacterium]MCB9475629.1 hypothetical protein [Deltaproteobacteria bacterium]MCB9490226.1 hypothetical protein [Deltaproteobacteria bacterium]
MALTIEYDIANADEAEDALRRMGRGLEDNRRATLKLDESTRRHGQLAQQTTARMLAADQAAALQRDAMTAASFNKWIGHAMAASEWTRTAFGGTINAIGRGIADELVDGTHDWRNAMKQVLKQMIAVTAQLVIMRTLMTVVTGGSGGFIGLFHAGGQVMHRGGPVRAHSGMAMRHDEVPLIAQRGEFVLRRRAVDAVGLSALQRLNRGTASGASLNPTFHINVTTNENADPARLARDLGPEIVRYLRRESERGIRVV